jgi:hypothetical protein
MKKSDTELDPDPSVRDTDPGSGSGSASKCHCFKPRKGVTLTWFEMTGQGVRTTRAKMKFLDIKDSRLLLQAIHSPCYRRTVKKPIRYSSLRCYGSEKFWYGSGNVQGLTGWIQIGRIRICNTERALTDLRGGRALGSRFRLHVHYHSICKQIKQSPQAISKNKK